MEKHFLSAFSEKEHPRLRAFYADKSDDTFRFAILAKLTEELGEVSEALLKHESIQRTQKLQEQDNLAEELADVILVTSILARELGIDIERALEEKVAKVNERAY